jgi:hypothetical protein
MRPISEVSRDDVHAAFHAKVEGAKVLDRLTRPLDLDFFVLFSSAAATIGMRNGALYAAANSCLGEIVRERREHGYAALNVEWGSWEYKRADRQRALIERSGFDGMQPAQALKALESLLQENYVDGFVAAVDWSVLGPALEMRNGQSLVEDVLAERGVAKENLASAAKISPLLESLTGLSKEQRIHRLCDFVSGEVRKLFGMGADEPLDESRGLFQMGMDSLMSVGLKQALEAGTALQLSATFAMTYSDISAIATFLEEKLISRDFAPDSTDTIAVQSYSYASADVSAMDDEETRLAIAAELATLQQKLGGL